MMCMDKSIKTIRNMGRFWAKYTEQYPSLVGGVCPHMRHMHWCVGLVVSGLDAFVENTPKTVWSESKNTFTNACEYLLLYNFEWMNQLGMQICPDLVAHYYPEYFRDHFWDKYRDHVREIIREEGWKILNGSLTEAQTLTLELDDCRDGWGNIDRPKMWEKLTNLRFPEYVRCRECMKRCDRGDPRVTIDLPNHPHGKFWVTFDTYCGRNGRLEDAIRTLLCEDFRRTVGY